jgi:hypothetical protein
VPTTATRVGGRRESSGEAWCHGGRRGPQCGRSGAELAASAGDGMGEIFFYLGRRRPNFFIWEDGARLDGRLHLPARERVGGLANRQWGLTRLVDRSLMR